MGCRMMEESELRDVSRTRDGFPRFASMNRPVMDTYVLVVYIPAAMAVRSSAVFLSLSLSST